MYILYIHRNIGLLFFYFFIATIASLIGLSEYRSNTEWHNRTVIFGKIIYITFEVASSIAFFVTFFDLVLLSHELSYINVTQHIINTIAMFIEVAFSAMIIRFDHLAYALTWTAVYLIVISILVATITLGQWPYYFLDNSTKFSYVWYTVLVIAVVVFYTIAWSLTLLKAYFFPSLRVYTSYPPADEDKGQNYDLTVPEDGMVRSTDDRLETYYAADAEVRF